MATGNHSTKPVFFFHFFLKPHAEGKLTECQLPALHTASQCFQNTGNKAENNTETKTQKQKVELVLSTLTPFHLGLPFDSLSKLMERDLNFELKRSE